MGRLKDVDIFIGRGLIGISLLSPHDYDTEVQFFNYGDFAIFLFHKKDAQRKCNYMITAMITLVYFSVPISLYYG